MWSLINRGDLLIEVVAQAGLTVLKVKNSLSRVFLVLAGSSRQGVGTVHASSNFAASHHYES